ncbi:lipoma-preferred partner homolog isoform X2 [Contarinia nasturtii]|uniref:lipoma-preferred partner homolog isoform X2 n=1 Tax=Contarinia nasturtii TaxID=265458 RepID=UPI0012D433F0|nr:lipoma-preferred partner homolog isoform X2 [Contarinia nasturtii]
MNYLSGQINLFGIVFNILLLTFNAIAWQVPEVNYQANTGFETPSYPTVNYQVPVLPVPPVSTYPAINYQPPVYTSSWQESQKSGSTGYQGPMLTPAYGGRNNAYPIASNVGSNNSPSVQRPNYGYAYTPQQAYAPNYDYGPRNYNYPNPTYAASNHGSRSYDYPRSHSSPVQNIHTPNYDQTYPASLHFGSNPMANQGPVSNHAFGPNESHVESNQVFDQRNYGFSSASRHETNTQPLIGDVY